ncbi:MAG: hypothetical protein B6I24_04690 [Bacteroidetes bacterium 4572_128]|nr:MAG: hypothetical protein B6I24_04690 [Bacteroidetes bacterium 4572_128]
MNLIIDAGNTFMKFYVFDKHKKLIYKNSILNKELENIIFFKKNVQNLKKNFFIKNLILSSVVNFDNLFLEFIRNNFKKFVFLDAKTNLPIKNLYKTKGSLGKDRIAAVVGGNFIFPNKNILIIDSGTAITFDFINDKSQYLGGNISLGLEMRFKALNFFTKKLPHLSKKNFTKLFGNTSETAIICGVQNSFLFETKTYISNFSRKYKDLKIIFTGGETDFFKENLKMEIFIEKNLVGIGLNEILNF